MAHHMSDEGGSARSLRRDLDEQPRSELGPGVVVCGRIADGAIGGGERVVLVGHGELACVHRSCVSVRDEGADGEEQRGAHRQHDSWRVVRCVCELACVVSDNPMALSCGDKVGRRSRRAPITSFANGLSSTYLSECSHVDAHDIQGHKQSLLCTETCIFSIDCRSELIQHACSFPNQLGVS